MPEELLKLLECNSITNPVGSEGVPQCVRSHEERQAGIAHNRLHDQPEPLAGEPLPAVIQEQRNLRRVMADE